ncbi:MAG: hypothetical protein R3D46_08410 [Defluviimonas denitrificans]
MRLEAIETIVPEQRIDVADTIRDAGGGVDEIRLFQQLFEMQTLAAADPAKGMHGYLADLLDRIGPAPQELGPVALLHAHSLPARSGQRLADLGRLASHPALATLNGTWDVDQFNCAGMFYALAAAERMLRAGTVGSALIFGGDCLSDWPLAQRYVPTCTALGDGYALLRVSKRPGGLQLGDLDALFRGLCGRSGWPGRGNGPLQPRPYRHCAPNPCHGGTRPRSGSLFPHNINGLSWRLFLAYERAGTRPDP